MRRVAFVSLGCPKNLVDSEQMLGALDQAGFDLVSDHADADAIVVNTCGFLEASKDESLDVIREAVGRKQAGELQRVVVAGCLVQRHRAKMLEWEPGIDAMIGVFDRDHIVEAVSGAAAGATDANDSNTAAIETGTGASDESDATPRYWIAANALQAARARGVDTVGLTVHGADGSGLGYFEGDTARLRLTPRHWSYLRMSEGCNQACAFCTIPAIRGKMRSKRPEDVWSEARRIMSEGAFELNLIGQDTTSYGYDIGYDRQDEPDPQGLIGLLRGLDAVAGEFGGGWLRLMYAYPTYFTDAMIDAIAALPNVCNYIDIPLQHATDRMLTSMRRNTTQSQQAALLDKLRDRIPGLAIRTTFITGYPGETDADHRELVDFIEDVQFDMLGVFKYSREEGTPAGTLDLDPALHVPDEIKEEREAEIMLTQQAIAFENAAYVAEQRVQFDVLIDGTAPGGSEALQTTGVSGGGRMHMGRCYHQAPQVDSTTWVFSERDLAPGELVRCTIVDASGYDLVAQPTEQLERSVSLPIMQ